MTAVPPAAKERALTGEVEVLRLHMPQTALFCTVSLGMAHFQIDADLRTELRMRGASYTRSASGARPARSRFRAGRAASPCSPRIADGAASLRTLRAARRPTNRTGGHLPASS
jgi:hypothetical protein